MFKDPIVTEIKELKEFYRAEGYHQDYIEHNPDNPYVRNVSIPRFELFKKTYKGNVEIAIKIRLQAQSFQCDYCSPLTSAQQPPAQVGNVLNTIGLTLEFRIKGQTYCSTF